MANLLKYALLLAADLAIIGCVVHYCFRTLHWHTPFEEPHYRTPKLEKLKQYSYYAVVLLGFALALYGSLIFLFSWMPHRWHDEDGMWEATSISILGAFWGTLALLSGLGKTADKIFKLKFREAKAEAFQKLIEQELDQFGWALRHPEQHKIEEAEKSRTIYDENARVCRNLVSSFRMALSERSNRNPT
jgi:hypothetical protein